MTDYLTNDTDLTAVANAIRTKGGTSSSLSFPTGFAEAIANIPSGGGGSQWEEVNMGGTGYSTWDIWAILDQTTDTMGADVSITVGYTEKKLTGAGINYYHFINVPHGTSVSWNGTGDSINCAWAKKDNWVSTQGSYSSSSGSTTTQISTHNSGGTMMIIVASPEP